MTQEEFYRMLKEKNEIMLNDQQRAAIDYTGSACVLAVPGAGKTTVIVSKIANLILVHNVSPENILTLTFSRAAAKDMKSRFVNFFGDIVDKNVHFSTIHSFSYMVLRYYYQLKGLQIPTIIEGEDDNSDNPALKAKILKQIYQEVNNMPLSDDLYESILQTTTLIKNKMLDIDKDADESEFAVKNFKRIFKAYEEYKQENNYIDYNDMLTKAISIFNGNPDVLEVFRKRYKYVLVDEAQDTSVASNMLVRMIVQPSGTVFFAGDDDQCLYGFNGCSPQNMFEYEKNYPGIKLLYMEQNFRSTSKILSVANDFIKKNTQRFNKNIVTNKSAGKPIELVSLINEKSQYAYLVDELKKIPDLNNCAILYRNNLEAIPIADALDKNGISFYLRDTKAHFFNHWLTQDIVSFIKFANDPCDFESFKKIYYKMNAYISKSMIEYVEEVIANGISKNIFELLLKYPFLNPRQKARFDYLSWIVPLVKNKTAKAALDFIDNEFKYSEYLKRVAEELGYTVEYLNSILSINKAIAEEANTSLEYIERLEHLKNVMDNAKNNKSKNAVTLSTLHSSKGLEFQTVFIIDMIEGNFPSSSAISDLENGNILTMEEERRLCYVGITRAKERAVVINVQKKNQEIVPPSRFYIELQNIIKTSMIAQKSTH